MSEGIRIEFDNEGGVFRTGEAVGGAVVVDISDGSACKRVTLRARWRTHGRGNTAKGNHGSLVLHEGPLPGPGVHRLPFRFEAPAGPFTYHGTYLEVDHYLEAHIEVPWAVNPKVEERFVLVPGRTVPPPPSVHDSESTAVAKKSNPRAAIVIGLAVAGIGFATLPLPGLVFLAFGGFLTVAGLWKRAGAMRVGVLHLAVEPRVLAPGDPVRAVVRFTPPRAASVRAIALELRATEICVSGGGKNRSVHRHVGHTEASRLAGGLRLDAGVERMFEATFTAPALGMWSFSAKHNELVWEVVARVDIPSWPDATATSRLIVWPRSEPEPERVAPAALVPPSRAGRADRPDRADQGIAGPAVALPAEPVASATKNTPDGADTAATTSGADPFVAAVRDVVDSGVISGHRRRKAAALIGRRVTCDVTVERVQRPFGRSLGPHYDEGRILRGTITDPTTNSTVAVEVLVPDQDAEAIDHVATGTNWVVEGTVVEWARLPERPVIRARPHEP